MRRPLRVLMRHLATVVAAALLLVLPGAPAPAAATATGSLAVTGFQEESDPPALIDASRAALTTVGVDGVNLLGSGADLTPPSPAALHQLARARADHLSAVLLIGNFDDAIDDFSEPVAHRMLGDAANVQAVSSQLAGWVRSQGWNGVSVDLESLLPRDAPGLAAFVGALRGDLPAADVVSVDVTNYTSVSEYVAAGYDLKRLSEAADRITLMGYDEHGPWENEPGPVGALAWQQAGLTVVERWVAPGRIDLGVAGYGYAWRPHDNVQLSDTQARALVARDHAAARFDTGAGEWTASLSDGSTLWWSDARSYVQRVALARADHLHGLAVWSLGLSDPLD